MECKGKLINAAKDWVSGKFRLTFEIEDDVSDQIDGIADKPLRIKAAHWREKRSLDSNAYYWVYSFQNLPKTSTYQNHGRITSC